jgi:hypothetical protein
VIARRGGGALETILDGVTGCFWAGGAEELIEAVLGFDDVAVDPEDCTSNAARFDQDSFRRGMQAEVAAAMAADSRPPASDRQPLATARLLRRAAREAHR